MQMSRLFRNLPEEFTSPAKAAETIAYMDTIHDREAYWLRLPACWHPTIGVFVINAIAFRISSMPDKAARRAALDTVPALWKDQVRLMTESLWRTRAIRADYTAQQAAARADAIAKGRW